MKISILLSLLLSFLFFAGFMMNSAPVDKRMGCGGAGCHTEQGDLFSVKQLDNLRIQVSVQYPYDGNRVAGEVKDKYGNIIDFVSPGFENPFTLSTPKSGEYFINVGLQTGELLWQKQKIQIGNQKLSLPVPSRTRTNFKLYPNHPNPFKSETMIRFSLPKPANISIYIFTMDGKIVRDLTRGRFPAGIHTVVWDGKYNDGRYAPSGTYLCEIKSDSKRLVRRMVLSRELTQN